MTLLLQIKYIMYVFFQFFANLHGQCYTLLSLYQKGALLARIFLILVKYTNLHTKLYALHLYAKLLFII